MLSPNTGSNGSSFNTKNIALVIHKAKAYYQEWVSEGQLNIQYPLPHPKNMLIPKYLFVGEVCIQLIQSGLESECLNFWCCLQMKLPKTKTKYGISMFFRFSTIVKSCFLCESIAHATVRFRQSDSDLSKIPAIKAAMCAQLKNNCAMFPFWFLAVARLLRDEGIVSV